MELNIRGDKVTVTKAIKDYANEKITKRKGEYDTQHRRY